MKFKETVGPQTVNHVGQLPAVSISFNLRPASRSARPSTTVTAVAKQMLPPTVTTSFQGSAKVFQSSMSNLTLLLVLAIGVVYIVLGMLYESYIHPLTILSGLPSAGLGALVTLWLFGNELNIYSFVGLIMLIGIVKKNAIMQIDFALDAGAPAGQVAGRGDLRGLHHPLPPDHDDHDGGAPRRAADRASATAPAARRAGRSAWPSSAGWSCRSSSRCT